MNAIHACRTCELPWWIDDELWVVELADEIVEAPRGLVARRGRLVERVAFWGPESARALADACLEHALAIGEQALLARGRGAAPHDADPALLRSQLAERARGETDDYASTVLAYLADIAEYAASERRGSAPWASCTAYVTAVLAGYAATSDRLLARGSQAYRDERERQADWLRSALGLAADL